MNTINVAEFTSTSAAQLSNLHGGTLNLGPLSLTWNLDISIPQFMASATLFGVSIGQVVIDKTKPSATIGGNIGIGEAEVVLTVDFTTKEVDYKIDVEAFGKVIVKKQGKLFTW